LTDRAYLGPTSTDSLLSFVMCNQGHVQTNDFVLDPFVGSAGLLIAASHFGAQTFGQDIDSRVIHGSGNFIPYNL